MPWLMLFFSWYLANRIIRLTTNQGQTLFNCSTIISATVEIKKILPMEKKINKKVFKFDELTNVNSVFKTMCVAKVERNFKVDASRLGSMARRILLCKDRLDFLTVNRLNYILVGRRLIVLPIR